VTGNARLILDSRLGIPDDALWAAVEQVIAGQ
jgi:hypothetical protein